MLGVTLPGFVSAPFTLYVIQCKPQMQGENLSEGRQKVYVRETQKRTIVH